MTTNPQDHVPESVETVDKPSDEVMSQVELMGWIEFGCWIALGFTPVLYLVNGPAVSTDQLVMRWIVVCGSFAGASGLAAYRIMTRARRDTAATDSQSSIVDSSGLTSKEVQSGTSADT